MDYVWVNEHSIIITICLGLILCFLNYLLAPKNIILTGVIIISTAIVYVFYMFIASLQVEINFVNNTVFIFNVILLGKIADSKIIYNLFLRSNMNRK